MIAVAKVVAWFIDRLEAVVDPLLPGSEQFNLQQRRAIETAGAFATDRAFLQQGGIFPAPVPSPALAPAVPPNRMMMATKLKARFSISTELYLAVRTASSSV